MTPPTLITLAQRTIREGLFGRGDLVLCACSGGPDSTALLHVLAGLRRRLGHEVVAVGVDHGLRPEAADELALVAELATAENVPFESVAVRVEAGGDLQARARKARHLALQEAAARRGAAVIALGHTADDRAETVIMRILRGTGPRGLAVMPARSAGIDFSAAGVEAPVDLVRPLVRARRSDVAQHLARHRLRHAVDPTNVDRRFLRSRVRAEIMPLLEALSPAVVAHLCHLAETVDPERDDPLSALSRPQRLALAQALRSRRSGFELRLPGGYDLELTFRRTGRGGASPR